jgi:hypothetical protein
MADDCTARELEHRSQAWRPWRSYAVMLLWQAARDLDAQKRRIKHAHVDSHHPASRRGRGMAAAGVF